MISQKRDERLGHQPVSERGEVFIVTQVQAFFVMWIQKPN